jgi:hypothetical protein
VAITYWGQPNDFQNAKDKLEPYRELNRKIDIQYEDADKNRTQAIAAGVKTLPTIYVQVGNKKEEAKGLTEEDITGSIVRAIKGGDRMVCFASGSGERDLTDTGPDGYSKAKQLVESANYKTKVIQLLPKPDIPADCTVTVFAGPKHDYIAPEVTAIKNYVEDGGRALFLLDPPLQFTQPPIDENTMLTDVLAGWGVTVQKDLVLDLSGVGQLFGAGPSFPIVSSYDSHAIVNDLKNTSTGFPLVRSLEVKNGDKTMVDKLFETTEESIATTNLSSGTIKPSAQDLKGPLTLGAAGTYTNSKGNGRFVVVGTSGFPANGYIGFQGNRDLFLNTLNWLSSDEDLISIRPKQPTDSPLNMNGRQVAVMQYSSVFGIPLLILAFGAGVWWRRR